MPSCRWHRCRGPLDAIRASRRYCSVACRVAAHRSRAHAQRLRACTVELVGRREAVAVIVRYEHLGTMGNATLFFGLRSPAGILLSLVGFGKWRARGGFRLQRCPGKRLDVGAGAAQQRQSPDRPRAALRTPASQAARGQSLQRRALRRSGSSPSSGRVCTVHDEAPE
jgi:hypothetical protein